MPLVSILLPVRDALPHLGAALRSIWRQQLTDYQVIAVDDGSRDGSGELLDRVAAREPRLTVIHSAPCGLPSALNLALARVRAPFVARHDADDLSHRRRLGLQVSFLSEHARIAVVGCRLRLFPDPAIGAGMRRWALWHNALLTHAAMMDEMLIDSPLAHGTAMFRAAWLERIGGWRDRDWPEDLDLWLRLAAAGARFAKLPQVLYGWRQHAASATRRDPRYQPARFHELRMDHLESGILRGATRVTLIGVGESVQGWYERLHGSRKITTLQIGRPASGMQDKLHPPMVLVFGAFHARKRWRHALSSFGMVERRDFIFVA